MTKNTYDKGRLNLPFVGICTFGKYPYVEDWDTIGADIAVIGAPTVSHPFPPDPPCAPHVSQLNAGSATVWINGIKVGRIGDSADAGAMTTGSPDVTAGP